MSATAYYAIRDATFFVISKNCDAEVLNWHKLTHGISLDPPKNHHHQFVYPNVTFLDWLIDSGEFFGGPQQFQESVGGQ